MSNPDQPSGTPAAPAEPEPARERLFSRGRPSKLTADLQARIVETIKDGCYLDTACARVGISPETYRTWLRRGARASRGVHHDFLAAVEKAEADAEWRAASTIRLAQTRSWQAAAWWLERRFPEKWADAIRIERGVKQVVEKVLEVLRDELSPDQFRSVDAKVRAAVGGIE